MLRRPHAWLALLACLLLACRTHRTTEPDARAPRSTDQYDAAGRLFVGGITPEHPDELTVVDLTRGVELGNFTARPDPAQRRVTIAVAPSGRLVASLHSDYPRQPHLDPGTGEVVTPSPSQGDLLVWDPNTRALLGRIPHAGDEPILGFAFSADERSLLIATSRGLERRGLDGRRLTAWQIPGLRVFTAIPNRPGTWLLAIETPRRRYYARLDESRPRPRALRLRGSYGVTRMRVSPDGRWLAVGMGDGGLELWDLTARRAPALRTEDWVHDLAFSPDSHTFAASVGLACGPSPRVIAWDLPTERVLLDLEIEAHNLHVTDRELLVGQWQSLDRIDLATGRATPIVQHTCASCGIRLCG